MKTLIPLMFICALGLVGCDGDARTQADQPPKAGEKWNMKIDPQLESFVMQARGDLARRLEIDESKITVTEAAFVTWPNSALGCPDSDMMYTQALVPGYRIHLDAGGDRYHYHGATGKPPIHCPADRVASPAADSTDSGDVT